MKFTDLSSRLDFSAFDCIFGYFSDSGTLFEDYWLRDASIENNLQALAQYCKGVSGSAEPGQEWAKNIVIQHELFIIILKQLDHLCWLAFMAPRSSPRSRNRQWLIAECDQISKAYLKFAL